MTHGNFRGGVGLSPAEAAALDGLRPRPWDAGSCLFKQRKYVVCCCVALLVWVYCYVLLIVVYIYIYIYIYIHTYIHTHVYTYIHTYIHTYIFIYMYIYTHTRTHICIYIYTYIYTYIIYMCILNIHESRGVAYIGYYVPDTAEKEEEGEKRESNLFHHTTHSRSNCRCDLEP